MLRLPFDDVEFVHLFGLALGMRETLHARTVQIRCQVIFCMAGGGLKHRPSRQFSRHPRPDAHKHVWETGICAPVGALSDWRVSLTEFEEELRSTASITRRLGPIPRATRLTPDGTFLTRSSVAADSLVGYDSRSAQRARYACAASVPTQRHPRPGPRLRRPTAPTEPHGGRVPIVFWRLESAPP